VLAVIAARSVRVSVYPRKIDNIGFGGRAGDDRQIDRRVAV